MLPKEITFFNKNYKNFQWKLFAVGNVSILDKPTGGTMNCENYYSFYYLYKEKHAKLQFTHL